MKLKSKNILKFRFHNIHSFAQFLMRNYRIVLIFENATQYFSGVKLIQSYHQPESAHHQSCTTGKQLIAEWGIGFYGIRWLTNIRSHFMWLVILS